MNGFAKTLADRAEAYIGLRRSLGYSFSKQAATLRALVRYVEQHTLGGPLTRAMALDWVLSWEGTPNPSSRIRGFFGSAPIADQWVGRKGLHYSRWRGTEPVAMRGGGCGGNWSLSCWIRSLSSGSGWV